MRKGKTIYSYLHQKVLKVTAHSDIKKSNTIHIQLQVARHKSLIVQRFEEKFSIILLTNAASWETFIPRYKMPDITKSNDVTFQCCVYSQIEGKSPKDSLFNREQPFPEPRPHPNSVLSRQNYYDPSNSSSRHEKKHVYLSIVAIWKCFVFTLDLDC